MDFKKAVKSQSKLRLALFAPSGAGKTYTSLRIAKGISDKLNKKIAVIDTERGSASKYSDRFEFDVVELKEPTIDNYVKLIDMASSNNYDVLIIDSMSHGWIDLLQEVDRIAKAKYRGNTWSAWSEGSPKQKKLIDSILNCNSHIIATMRVKTDWTVEKDERTGKNRPVRLGLSPEQGKGIEYEFDLLMEMNTEHFATIIKDRTGKYQDSIIEKPDENFGESLLEWLSDGVSLLEKAKKEIEDCKDIESLKTIWSKYSNFQTDKIFIKAKDDKKVELETKKEEEGK